MGKKILFITTVNLSTNPRILKEIRLALSLGYQINFLGFHLGNWSDELDREIRQGIPSPEFIYLDASRTNYIRWLGHSLSERFNTVRWKLNRKNLFLAASASTKRTFALLDFGKKLRSGDFDLVIGHTLGALYPASVMAKRAGCPFAFDVEDYHPGEHMDRNNSEEISRRKLIMKRILPEAAYVSASSPLIGSMTKELCGLDGKKLIRVLNYFSAAEFRQPILQTGKKIKLIWFSQFIGPGRGLEFILAAWDSLKKDFELTLVGNAEHGLKEIIREGIEIVPPLQQSALHELLSRYDIGLALELTGRDKNRDIALTNKILAYYQAGLYILATDTAAQKDFIDGHPGTGKLFPQNDGRSLLNAMKEIQENIIHIRSGAINRFHDAVVNSWEHESGKLKDVWASTLN